MGAIVAHPRPVGVNKADIKLLENIRKLPGYARLQGCPATGCNGHPGLVYGLWISV